MEIIADVGSIKLAFSKIVLGLIVDAENDGAFIRIFFNHIHLLFVSGLIDVLEIFLVEAKWSNDLFIFIELNLEILDVSINDELGFGFMSDQGGG